MRATGNTVLKLGRASSGSGQAVSYATARSPIWGMGRPLRSTDTAPPPSALIRTVASPVLEGTEQAITTTRTDVLTTNALVGCLTKHGILAPAKQVIFVSPQRQTGRGTPRDHATHTNKSIAIDGRDIVEIANVETVGPVLGFGAQALFGKTVLAPRWVNLSLYKRIETNPKRLADIWKITHSGDATHLEMVALLTRMDLEFGDRCRFILEAMLQENCVTESNKQEIELALHALSGPRDADDTAAARYEMVMSAMDPGSEE